MARVVQFEVPNPERWVRVGYGELLLPRVGAGAAEVGDEARALVDAVQAHPWVPPVDPLTVTAAIVQKQPGESASEWLKRARRALQEGRSKSGRSKVYTA